MSSKQSNDKLPFLGGLNLKCGGGVDRHSGSVTPDPPGHS